MELAEAADIIFRDLMGYHEPDFPSAYVTIAYSDQKLLDEVGLDFNVESMQDILAAALADRTGALPSLVKAAIQTKPQFCNFALMNSVDWKPLLTHKVSQEKAPIESLDAARSFLLDPGCPKFVAACDYVMETGLDVPIEFREEFTKFFNETLAESGYTQGDDHDQTKSDST